MKKIILGILALSAVSFGATEGETASVPVTVKAVITEAPSGLAIVDEVTGQVDQVVIDHGTIKKGTLSQDSPSIQTKGFRVVRVKSGGTKLEALGATQLSVGLSAKTTTLTKIGGSDTLTSNLELYHKTGTLATPSTTNPATGEGSHYTVTTQTTDTEHRGEIRSIITTTESATEGRYDNMTSRPTLAVKIDAIN
ncbi:hypothetical protein [Cetobacterium sp.]|uniref:hypothetical protein n=1 Tax=Cetobacterium sp. TaxID=2071632 RepID=UPI003F32C370